MMIGLPVAILAKFNQMNGRIDQLQADMNARFDQMFDRRDRMQAENDRRFDALLETTMNPRPPGIALRRRDRSRSGAVAGRRLTLTSPAPCPGSPSGQPREIA